jgi:hypothetical protein
MAVNPPLLGPGGMPAGILGEQWCCRVRGGGESGSAKAGGSVHYIDTEPRSAPRPQRHGIAFAADTHEYGKLRGTGVIYLTTVRICFVLDRPTPSFAAFDIPLEGISGERFQQPIFGANYLQLSVAPVPGRGLSAPAAVKLTFNQGGCNTFLRLFFGLMQRVHAESAARAALLAASSVQSFLEEVQAAYIDPSDPSVIYLTQPAR